MRDFFFLFFSLMIFFSGFSQNISSNDAKIIATNFYNEQFPDQHQSLKVKSIINFEDNKTLYFYIANFEDAFVIISPYRNLTPIIGWSFNNGFVEEEVPPAMAFLLDYYKNQIDFALINSIPINKKINQRWNHYLQNEFNPIEFNSIGPFLTSNWSQGCYYNTMFPEELQGPCDHLYVGCVAVSMGQIMNYWNFPEHGIGSHTYESDYGTISADFENTFYQWSEMPDVLNDENDAIAQLLFHTAISVNTQFFPEGSGAFDVHIPDALKTYFNYENAVEFIFRDDYNGDWTQLIIDELDLGHPLIYGGVEEATQAGHTFICDGYQDENLFHINWGWGGSYNGYFSLGNLFLGQYTWDTQHDVVIGIYPEGMSVDEQNTIDGFDIFPNPAKDILSIFSKNNQGIFEGVIYDVNGRVVEKLSFKGQVLIPVDKYENGIFVIQIISESKSYSYKFNVFH